MKINDQILNIPPYISSSWQNVSSLHVQQIEGRFVLIVSLITGISVEIPDIEPNIVDTIFTAHARYIEKTTMAQNLPLSLPHRGGELLLNFGLSPLKIGSGNDEVIGTLLEHNAQQSNTPDLPEEVLRKITSIAQAVGLNGNTLPQAEAECNCPHCQIARALQKTMNAYEIRPEEKEEIVSDEDLKFRSWDIQSEGDKLYSVTNPIDNKELYHVYLGEPLGCTCGEKHCEHLRAVLLSSTL